MKDNLLKNIIFFLMLIAKLVTIGLVFFHYSTYGFLNKANVISIITLISPLFMVYITVMLKDLLSNPYRKGKKKGKRKAKRVKNSISTLTFIVFPIYFFAIIISINLTAKGDLKVSELQGIIGILESVFGIYIGQIILTLFKKEEKNIL